MRKLKFIGVVALIGIYFSCSSSDVTQEQEAQNLNQMFSEIENLSTSVNCNDPSEWTFTSYGSKACGGPMGYIAYPKDLDTEPLLNKIEEHRMAQQDFNEKWGIISDCSVPPQPSGVLCEDGNPKLEYFNLHLTSL